MSKLRNIVVAIVVLLSVAGCTDIHDNIRSFDPSEKVYPARYVDSLVSAKVGYERIEIDLLGGKRVPTSQIQMPKALKTIIVYDNGRQTLVLDSVVSWVNVTGLTKTQQYTFRIYTEGADGNRSVPTEIVATPFTDEDKQILYIAVPQTETYADSAVLRWTEPITSPDMDFLGLTYEYTNDAGNRFKVSSAADVPRLRIVNPKRPVTNVAVEFRVLPKRDAVQILDTVVVKRSYEL
jgi:hypothetical protein